MEHKHTPPVGARLQHDASTGEFAYISEQLDGDGSPLWATDWHQSESAARAAIATVAGA